MSALHVVQPLVAEHGCSPCKAGHAAPPNAAAVTTVRERVWTPDPHVAAHADQSDQSETTHATAGGGVVGGVVGGAAVGGAAVARTCWYRGTARTAGDADRVDVVVHLA